MDNRELLDRAKFLLHGDTMIYSLDFSNLAFEDARAVVEQGKKTIGKMPKRSILTLTNVENIAQDAQFNALAAELTSHNKPYVMAGAVVGVSGWRKIAYLAALMFSGRDNLKLFNGIEEAKVWLSKYDKN